MTPYFGKIYNIKKSQNTIKTIIIKINENVLHMSKVHVREFAKNV